MGEKKLPPDWLSIHMSPKPAEGFAAEFGYNALRIPLYLMRAGDIDKDMLTILRNGMTGPNGDVQVVELPTGNVRKELGEAGYRIIPALVSCVVDGTALPKDLLTFVPSLYYPSTLHLLALSFAAERHQECL